MFRSIALSALAVLTLASAPAPAFAQTGVSGASGGTTARNDCGPACDDDDNVRRGGPGYVQNQPPQRIPPGYYRPDPRPDPRPRPPRPPHHPRPPIYIDPGYYRPPVYQGYDRVSCREARQIVREEGFRDVRAIDCEGRQYQFQARRKGRFFIVVVSSRSGDIIDVSRL
jgi:hypothetical protein